MPSYRAIFLNMIQSTLLNQDYEAENDSAALDFARSSSKFPILLSRVARYGDPDPKTGQRNLFEIKLSPQRNTVADITIIDHGELS
jgi:hypothetical protein